MSDRSLPDIEALSPTLARRVDQVCDHFELAWKGPSRPRIEDFVAEAPEPVCSALLRELIMLEVVYRRLQGEDPQPADYARRFPGLNPDWLADAVVSRAVDLQHNIGRYRVERVLGEGGFGRVYLARDEQLNRPVAIKVPHRRLSRPQEGTAFLVEARILARLDHPSIVPVYDVGSTADGLCYIVSKLIDGSDLAKKIQEARPSAAEAARLMAAVAEALHYAHRQGLVHRDMKPSNILIDSSNKPYVADFGLALREEDFGTGPSFAGTPAYMSPEQARREGHRVDARSDIFSLGVVFYELLTARLPFGDNNLSGVLKGIKTLEPCPPRQFDDAIPKELERICLKALAKRATDRYTSAKEMADDLQHFLEQPTERGPSAARYGVPHAALPTATPETTPEPVLAVKIVPKGLRSFDASDANFFLELLPGPRDRDGLPETIRFWKTRIEETDTDRTFTAGLIYGPSGCGKSSLVKAGLLPRLAEHVIAVYVEATAEETEARLLKRLRKHCAQLPVDLGLAESLAELRQGRGVPPGKKVLIVLDQFEQWLHGRRGEEDTELVQALRQCDGERVQCVVMVRDDFWMAATRFMQALEVRLLEGQNSAAVDLFDPRHAKKVLSAFGRAFAALPERDQERAKQQESFLEQAVAGLAQDGKVISVRLALFAEMVKNKPWIPATLGQMGGMEGVGVTFLDETFAASTAPPQHRLHQKAAQAILKALLPETGTDIKGNMRSRQDLLVASGYASRLKDFEDLLRILDSELRLITLTEPEGVDTEKQLSLTGAGERYYQLTHDYLVPSLGAWLTRKQKETRRGRAELLLADRASVWKAHPENRQLPSLLEWLQIRRLTQKTNLTPPQRKMMRKAFRYHAERGLVLAIVLALVGWGSYEGYSRVQAHAFRDKVLVANTTDVLPLVRAMAPYRRWVDPPLREAYHDAEAKQDSRKQLNASLALLPADPGQVDYLYERLLNAGPTDLSVIREALKVYRDDLVERLWKLLGNAQNDKDRRFRAACALATYDPDGDATGERWQNASKFVTDQLLAAVQKNPSHYSPLLEMLRPVRERLLTALAETYRDRERPESDRTFATTILADYAADQPQVLTDLLMDADEKQFAQLYPVFEQLGERGLPMLTDELDRKLPPDVTEDAKENRAKRQANAAVALLKMNQPATVWPLLKHSSDPRVRSYLIHRFGPLGAEAGAIVKRLEVEPDVEIRRALILSLGPEQFSEETWRPEEKKRLMQQLQDMYRATSDPGLHAATEWLLRQWHQDAWLQRTDEAWAKDKEQREKRLESIRQGLTKASRQSSAPGVPQWYVTGQGQTLVVIRGPVEFMMGSPLTEARRSPVEQQHRKRISRTFAIAAKAVTVEQFLRFQPRFSHDEMQRYPDSTCPIGGVLWYEAAAYCNWLSEQEGIPKDEWCFVTNQQGQVTKLKEGYLSLTGYRLPTEAEWEYACRAGAVTSRYYGESEELLGQYAWYLGNFKDRTWPVGSKKPNDLGLFDMHGNIWCWCQESYKDYPKANEDEVIEDKEDVLDIVPTTSRVLRGSSYGNKAATVRSADRTQFVPTFPNIFVGFRPARTFR